MERREWHVLMLRAFGSNSTVPVSRNSPEPDCNPLTLALLISHITASSVLLCDVTYVALGTGYSSITQVV